MKITPSQLTALGALILLLGCNRNSDTAAGGSSDSSSVSSGSSSSVASRSAADASTAPDNTGRNVRDRSDSSVTPGDQGENQADLNLTRRIRRAVTSNDQLSAEAKNIKIIAQNGKVTLRGPVKNDEEKKIIDSMAQQIAGGTIDDQLEIKTSNQ